MKRLNGVRALRVLSLAAAFAAFLGAFFAGAASVQAGPAEDAARDANKRAGAAYNLGHYEEAAREYEFAYRNVQDPALLFNIGQSWRLAGRPEPALAAYRSYLRTAPANAPNRDLVERRVVELEKIIADTHRTQGAPPADTLAPTAGAAPASPPAGYPPSPDYSQAPPASGPPASPSGPPPAAPTPAPGAPPPMGGPPPAAAGLAGPAPARLGFQGALRLGPSFPVGKADNDTGSLSRVFGAQVVLEGEAGAKLNKNVFLGGYLGVGGGALGTDVKTLCSDCTVSGARLGIEALFFPAPDAAISPWAGYGAGFEVWSVNAPSSQPRSSANWNGWELGHFMGGADLRVSSKIGLGGFVDVSVARYQTVTVRNALGADHSSDVKNPALHGWLTLGVRGVLYP